MARPRDKRLILFVLAGVLLGAIFVGFDVVSEEHLEEGTLTGTWASAHTLVDHLLPLVVGALSRANQAEPIAKQ